MSFEPFERVEGDYAGDPIEWYDIKTVKSIKPYVFVCGLGFSQLLFAWAAEDMKSRNWLACHRQFSTITARGPRNRAGLLEKRRRQMPFIRFDLNEDPPV